jgi:hypothetical protein
VLLRIFVGGTTLDAQTALLVHHPQPGHDSLPRPACGAVTLDQGPVRVPLTILASVTTPQVHAAMLRIVDTDSRGLVVTTSAFPQSKQTRCQGSIANKWAC